MDNKSTYIQIFVSMYVCMHVSEDICNGIINIRLVNDGKVVDDRIFFKYKNK